MKHKRQKADNLIPRRGKWYYRVYYRIDGENKEKQIPLRASSKVAARERSVLVQKVERDIKQNLIESNGKDYGFDFP